MPSPDVFVNGLQRCLSKHITTKFPQHDAVRYKAFREKWNEKSKDFLALTMRKSWEQMLFFELRKAMWPNAPPGEKKDGEHDQYTKSIYEIWQASMFMVGRETVSKFKVWCSSKLKGDLKERFEKRFEELWNHKSPTEYSDKQIIAELEKIFGDQIQKDFREFKSHTRKQSNLPGDVAAEQKRKQLLQKRNVEMSTELLVKMFHCIKCKEKTCILTNKTKLKMLNIATHIKTCKSAKCELNNCMVLRRLVSHNIKCKNSGKPCPNQMCEEIERRLNELNERERAWDETITTNTEIRYDMSDNGKGKATASYDVMYDVDDDVNEEDTVHDVLLIVPDDDDDDDDDEDDDDEMNVVENQRVKKRTKNTVVDTRKKKKHKECENEMCFPDIPIEPSVKSLTETLLRQDWRQSKMIPRKSFTYIADKSVPKTSLRIGEGVVKLLAHALHRQTSKCIESAAKRARYRLEDQSSSPRRDKNTIHITSSDILVPASRYQSPQEAWIDAIVRNSLLRQKNVL